jgi:MraZ protein
MTLFTSSYVNKVDKKGRVSVPAPFRQVLAGQSFQGVYVFPSLQHHALDACSASHMEQLSESLDDPDLPAEHRDLIETTIFGGSVMLPFDGEGRIVLPQEFAEFAGITEEAAFVGLRKTFQIWQPAAWKVHSTGSRDIARTQNISLSTIIATSQRLKAAGKAGS